MRGADFVALLDLTDSGRISQTTEKALLQRMFLESFDPVAYVRSHDLIQQTDEGELMETARQVVADNPDSVRDYLAGKDRALQYLTGQGMKALAGRADAKRLQDCIRELLKKVEKKTMNDVVRTNIDVIDELIGLNEWKTKSQISKEREA